MTHIEVAVSVACSRSVGSVNFILAVSILTDARLC